MAAIFFCKHQLLRQRLYAGAGLSLPALSFAALLTGFTFSLNLPSSLHAIMPIVESVFLVSLPELWRGFLNWISPPCLFVLLNGIIMILTATSGRSSSSCQNGSSVTESISDTQTDNLTNLPFKQDVAGLKQTLVATPYVETAPILEDNVQVEPFDEAVSEDKELDFVVVTKEESMQSINKELEQDFLCRSSSVSSFPSLCCSSSSLSLPYRPPPSLVDAASEETVKAGSVPSSPQYQSPGSLVKHNMRRSISIDSASFLTNREEPSDDQLSEEAFKKRIDDFIMKMTSKMSHETRVA